MAAVSTFPSGRGLSSRGAEPDPNAWEHNRRNSQDRTAISFSQPFHAIPQADQHSGPAHRPSSRQQVSGVSMNGTSKYSHAVAQHLNGQQEAPHESSQTSMPAPQNDSNYLSPFTHSATKAANISRSGSEADSLLDLYGQPRNPADSNERRENKTPPDTTPNAPNRSEYLYMNTDDPESSKWVHRDKLALIESHELQEAGIKLPRHSSLRGRSNSKSKNRRGQSRGHSRGQSMNGEESEIPPSRDGKRQRMRSPERQEQETPNLPTNFDLRTPEEIATNPYEITSSSMYRQQGLRASSSRIPLPTSSPMPIPQEHRERHTPLPRTRGASGSWGGEDDPIAYPKSRSRSQSVGSQILLDDIDPPNGVSTPIPSSTVEQQSTPSSTSPSKPRSASSKPLPTAAAASARKASAALRNNINTSSTPDQQQSATQPKPRSTSTNTASARGSPAASSTRPKSRSALETRPATAINRPEGEAPWLATMYKPDPRLPPDQQVIPTHAKKLQQQQQQQSEQQQPPHQDRPGSQKTSDARKQSRSPREKEPAFSPVAVHTNNGLQPPSPSSNPHPAPTPIPSPRALNEKSSAEKPGWPLKVSPNPSTTNLPSGAGGAGSGTHSPSTATNNNGGYSTMPKVHASSPVSVGAARVPRVGLTEKEEQMIRGKGKAKGEKEAGCTCCVVM